MTNVIFQPASGVEARDHYVNTVVNPVAYSKIATHISDDEVASLKKTAMAESICAWGIVPSGEAKWKIIQPGDTVLFARDNHFYSFSTVIGKRHSRSLAAALWGADNLGRTWEWMYFFLPPVDINIPYARLNVAVGYKSNYTPQGINVLRYQKAEAALECIYGEMPIASARETSKFIDGLESLDAVAEAVIRKEQGYLRRELLGDSSFGKCGICGNDFPVQFLVASHIKKRADCTDKEKADIPSIAMPMCLMGCDALYEKGYVTVDNGRVVVSHSPHASMANILQRLAGTPCAYWTTDREPYFVWHKQTKFRG